MLDIGIGEFLLIAVLAVIVFGPERLPRYAADAAKFLAGLRAQAAKARQDLVDAAAIDPSITNELKKSVGEFGELRRGLGDFTPRGMMSSLMTDPPPAPRGSVTPVPGTPAPAAAVVPFAEAAVADPTPAPAPPATAYDADAT